MNPSIVLSIYQQLKEVAKVEVKQIISSLQGDTVLKVSNRESNSCLSMLSELPNVAKVVEEGSYREDALDTSMEMSANSTSQVDVKRIRLILAD